MMRTCACLGADVAIIEPAVSSSRIAASGVRHGLSRKFEHRPHASFARSRNGAPPRPSPRAAHDQGDRELWDFAFMPSDVLMVAGSRRRPEFVAAIADARVG